MKKLFLLATAALMITGVTFASNEGKGKKKKCAKGKSCSSQEKKACHKQGDNKTVKL